MGAQTVSFDLHKLGWKAFEDLISCICKEVLGQTFQTFAEGADGGRDGAFHGTWRTASGEVMDGTFTIQCKHTSDSSGKITKSIYHKELEKIKRLAEKGLCDNYIFITNHSVSALLVERAEAAFRQAGAKYAKVYESSWINNNIATNPTLRRLVPRIYGLGDLSQIITHQAYLQAIAVLESSDLDCFVPTEAYRNCAHALQIHGFVILLGEPASGKTMIANLMALSAADEWKLQTLMISSPQEFERHWNPNEPKQFLWVDDAFGATQYDPERVREWNQLLPKLKSAIKNGARAVFTSRDYIFNSAISNLKTSSFELFEDSRVMIKVEQLSIAERQQILYNHLKCGSQPRKFLSTFKPYLVRAAETPKFLPEIARRFANPRFTENLTPCLESVSKFFEEPTCWMAGVIGQFSKADFSAIALVFIAGGNLPSPIPEDENILHAISTLGSTLGKVKAALNALNGSLLILAREKGREYWRFRHPTVQDAFADFVGTNRELIDIYLAGVTTERLMREVICGDVNVQGAKIVISPEKYDVLLERLRSVPRTGRWYSDPVGSFLAVRCGVDFIKRYFSEVDNIDNLPREILSVVPYDNSLKILVRLQEGNHIGSATRLSAVKRIYELSLDSYSLDFLDENNVGNLLNSDEVTDLLLELKSKILFNHDMIIADTERNWDKESDPYSCYYEISKTLNFIVNEGDSFESKLAASCLEDVNASLEGMESLMEEASEYANLAAEETDIANNYTVRSIFDDIDS